MKILFYPEIHKNFGTGNIIRMFSLYNYILCISTNVDVSFSSNDLNMAQKVIESIYSNFVIEQLNPNEYYDVILYDSMNVDNDMVMKLSSMCNRLITFDFFNYNNEYVDTIINLYNHNSKEVKCFKGKIYSGVQYVILKDEVIYNKTKLKCLSTSKFLNVLITFGGEDPNSNTIRALEMIDLEKVKVKVLLGPVMKDRDKIINEYGSKLQILEPTKNFGKLLSSNDIIICGGGTTLLEAIYLGNPVIAIPQNPSERDFIYEIKKNIKLFDIKDLIYLSEKCKGDKFRKDIYESYTKFVDGLGKLRIKEVIYGDL